MISHSPIPSVAGVLLAGLAAAGLACAGARQVEPHAAESETPPAPAAPAPPAPAPAAAAPAERAWPCRVDELPTDRAPSWSYDRAPRAADESPPPPVQGRFSQFVTAKVVTAGVSGALWSVETLWDDPPYNARYFACEALVCADRPEGCADSTLLYSDDARAWLWRRSVVAEARRHLSDPERLWAAWQEHRATVLDTIAAAGKGPAVRAFVVEQALPAFRQDFGGELCDLLGERARAWNGFVMEEGSRSEATQRQPDVHTVRNIAIVEFANRRGMEGGPALVDAWIRILEDVVRGLEGRDD